MNSSGKATNLRGVGTYLRVGAKPKVGAGAMNKNFKEKPLLFEAILVESQQKQRVVVPPVSNTPDSKASNTGAAWVR